MEEFYKEHSIYKCYVSNLGNVKTLKNNVLKGNVCRYRRVGLKNKITGKIHTVNIHRLVAELFIGSIENGLVVNHIDGNKLNNNVNNLEIITPKENSIHAIEMGLTLPMQGEYNGNSILKESDILKIYDLIKKGFNNEEISKIYNINFRTVSQIRTGFRWNYLFKKHFTKSIKSRNSKYSMEICIKIINELLNTNKKNIEISKEYNIEASLISRVRSKDTWLNVWDFYNRNATTIENT